MVSRFDSTAWLVISGPDLERSVWPWEEGFQTTELTSYRVTLTGFDCSSAGDPWWLQEKSLPETEE